MTLSDLHPGEIGIVKTITTKGPMRRRMLDLGLVPGTKVQMLFTSPVGNPIAYTIRGAVIALRQDAANHVVVQRIL